MSSTDARTRFIPDRRLRPDDRLVLMAAQATLGEGLRQADGSLAGHIIWDVSGWSRPDQTIAWTVEVPAEDDYAIEILVRQDTAAPVRIAVAGAGSRVTAELTERGPASRMWQRLPLEGTLRLPAGTQTLIASASCTAGPIELTVRAIEVVRPAVRAAQAAAAQAMRADTTWLQQAGYGVMVHWVPDCMPRHGERVPYEQAVDAFDVEAFAGQVADMGAGFVVFVTAHGRQMLPAPNQALDRILPGRTTRRDLIADLAAALGKRGIKLMLYYHLGSGGDQPWLEATGYWDTDSTRLFANWCAIIEEMGRRYGDRVAGWWFDDGTATYSWHQAPWQRLDQAAKAGFPQRLVGFNAWAWPMPTMFMDYNTGETDYDPTGFGWVPRDGDGIYRDGPGKGLQACFTILSDGDWVHSSKDTAIGPPVWSRDQLHGMLRCFAGHRIVPMFNCAIYQEGLLSQPTVDLFHAAR